MEPRASESLAAKIAKKDRREREENFCLERRNLDVQMRQDELAPFFNACAGEFDQIVSKRVVSCGESIVSALGFIEVLFALHILAENLAPGRSDKDGPVIPEFSGCVAHVLGGSDVHQAQVSKDVRDTTIKKDSAGALFGEVIRPHLPAEHQLGKQERIIPR